MLHDIGLEVNAYLASKGCPLRVVDGPEPTSSTTGARERIILEYDEDTFTNPRGAMRGARSYFIRMVGAKFTIFAQNGRIGATDADHRERCEQVLDLLVSAIYVVLKTRRVGFTISKGAYVPVADLVSSASIAGCAYALSISIERAVTDSNWKGEAPPTKTLGAGDLSSCTKVTDPSHPDPETGCDCDQGI